MHLKLQWSLRPAAPQGEHHFQPGRSGANHPKRFWVTCGLLVEKSEGGLQWFDRDACRAGAAGRSHIQAEPAVMEGRAAAEMQ